VRSKKLLFALPESALLADCSVSHLRRLIFRGELRVVRLGRAIRIPKSELLRVCGIAAVPDRKRLAGNDRED
jgi:excisionase family DNA binding protein